MYSVLMKQDLAHDDAIWSCAWAKSPKDGSDLILTGSVDDTVKCWKCDDEKLVLQHIFEGHALGVFSVDVSHDGKVAASSSLDSNIKLWDLETGEEKKKH